ncbi:HAMP domain-containing sensor histidine kinase [uncultured Pseudoteredinibacter sp.]|uniref:sensor histidine kinase n=1 Tax=uncultured Pseudoteredinibacter sp. TaxID=1641701 RepID=UPI00261A57FD|nr:HAMP domain-containing sensor histidine kinase [uncultured Pseudoteredinibacter sp.]
MLYPINSYFWRVLANLLPFSLFVVVFYSVLIELSIYGTEDHIAQSYLKRELDRVLLEGPSKLPSTSYFKSYRQSEGAIPKEYLSLESGIHELSDDNNHIAVAELTQHDDRIFIVLDENQLGSIHQLDNTIPSTLFAIGSIVLFASFFIAAILARTLAKPIVELAEDASVHWQPGRSLHGQDRKDELGILSRALAHLLQQNANQLEREKSFTRHASHEMRTPAAIIRNAISVLQLKDLDEDKYTRNLQRISNAGNDIETLVDTFLALGREHDQPASTQHWQHCNLEDMIRHSVLRQENIMTQKNMTANMDIAPNCRVLAHQAMLSVAIHNLIKNSANHGCKQLSIEANNEFIRSSNNIAEQQNREGYGYGQEIISRICQYHGWTVTFEECGENYISEIFFKAKSDSDL